jgi:hypothetical protein
MGTSSAWVEHGLASLPASSRRAGVGLCNASGACFMLIVQPHLLIYMRLQHCSTSGTLP